MNAAGQAKKIPLMSWRYRGSAVVKETRTRTGRSNTSADMILRAADDERRSRGTASITGSLASNVPRITASMEVTGTMAPVITPLVRADK